VRPQTVPADERPYVGRRPADWAALPALIVALLTMVGVALRVVIAGESVFADELSTYWIVSTNGFGGVISAVHSDAEITPPLYFVAAWLSTQIDLTPELLRAPALVAGAVTIPGVYLLGLRTVGRAPALVAAALTALAPFMVFYSAEARGYGLLMALVTLSTLAMLAAVDEGRARWWFVYAACSCAALYTHYTSVFVLGIQLLWLLWAHPEVRTPAVLANIGAVAAFLPWTSGLVKDLNSPTTDILSALSPFNPRYVRLSLEHWAIADPHHRGTPLRDLPGTPALVLLALALIVACAGFAASAFRERRRWIARLNRRALLVFALALSTPVGEALFSALGPTSLFNHRNLAASWPALALSIATLLVAAGPRLRFATAALAIASFGLGAEKLLSERFQRPDYQAGAAFIDLHAGAHDVVIDSTGPLSPGPFSPLEVALRRRHRVLRAREPQETFSEASTKAVDAAADGARIFVVGDLYVPVARMSAVRLEPPMPATGHFPARYRLVETRTYPGIFGVQVQVYVDRTSPRG
jgi:hypothetical protein